MVLIQIALLWEDLSASVFIKCSTSVLDWNCPRADTNQWVRRGNAIQTLVFPNGLHDWFCVQSVIPGHGQCPHLQWWWFASQSSSLKCLLSVLVMWVVVMVLVVSEVTTINLLLVIHMPGSSITKNKTAVSTWKHPVSSFAFCFSPEKEV